MRKGPGSCFAQMPEPMTFVRLTRVFAMLVLALNLGLLACSKSSSTPNNVSEMQQAISQFTQPQLAAALRAASFRLNYAPPSRDQVDEILAASDINASYELLKTRMHEALYSEQFRAVLTDYCHEMFGMSGTEDDPDFEDVCNFWVWVVMNDHSYKETLTADFMIQNGFQVFSHTSGAPALAGYLTIAAYPKKMYGNNFGGFNMIRGMFNISLCQNAPFTVKGGAWDRAAISPKYFETPDLDCTKCHAGSDKSAGPGTGTIGLNELRQLTYKFNAEGIWNNNRTLAGSTAESAGFTLPGSSIKQTLVEPVNGKAVFFQTEVTNLRELALQVVELDEFLACSTRRFLTMVLGLKSAGRPGVPINQQAELPEDLTTTSDADNEMFLKFKTKLAERDFKIREWLDQDVLPSPEWIGRAVASYK